MEKENIQFVERRAEAEPTVEELKAKIAVLEEILKRNEGELEVYKKLATKDVLTGLFNRRAFEEELQKAKSLLEYSNGNEKREKSIHISESALIFLDIDNFKSINDTYGHNAGDAVLKFVADALTKYVRTSDVVCRWGGEEITVLLLGCNEENGAVKAEKIRSILENSEIELSDGKKIKVTASFGVAAGNDMPDSEIWINSADKAMYAAKTGGKNQIVSFSQLPKENK